jgi:biopolymer transport protein ExbD
MRLRHRHQVEDESGELIDLAPMLDFVLNLLIFFIITAVFVKEIGLQLNSPPPQPPDQKQQDDERNTLFVVVHRNGDISIDQRLIDPAAVRANVERFRSERPNGPVVVVANTKAPTGIVVKAMDQARQGGALNVLLQPSTSRE